MNGSCVSLIATTYCKWDFRWSLHWDFHSVEQQWSFAVFMRYMHHRKM